MQHSIQQQQDLPQLQQLCCCHKRPHTIPSQSKHNSSSGLYNYNSGAGSCVGRMPKRFLQVMRSRENLSSGEKRAGWADFVGVPSGAIFCGDREGE